MPVVYREVQPHVCAGFAAGGPDRSSCAEVIHAKVVHLPARHGHPSFLVCNIPRGSSRAPVLSEESGKELRKSSICGQNYGLGLSFT
jgi:hypothetical protein